jgi:hypothetical protein
MEINIAEHCYLENWVSKFSTFPRNDNDAELLYS